MPKHCGWFRAAGTCGRQHGRVHDIKDVWTTAGSCGRQQGRVDDSRVVWTTAGTCGRQQGRVDDSRVVWTTAGSCGRQQGRVADNRDVWTTGVYWYSAKRNTCDMTAASHFDGSDVRLQSTLTLRPNVLALAFVLKSTPWSRLRTLTLALFHFATLSNSWR